MTYEHNQPKDIKKNSHNDTNVLCSSNLTIIWKLLFCRYSFRKKAHEKILKNGNKCQVKSKR